MEAKHCRVVKDPTESTGHGWRWLGPMMTFLPRDFKEGPGIYTKCNQQEIVIHVPQGEVMRLRFARFTETSPCLGPPQIVFGSTWRLVTFPSLPQENCELRILELVSLLLIVTLQPKLGSLIPSECPSLVSTTIVPKPLCPGLFVPLIHHSPALTRSLSLLMCCFPSL